MNHRPLPWLTLLAALAAPACKRDEVTHFQVRKGASAQPVRTAAPSMGSPGMGTPGMDPGAVPEPPQPAQGGLRWQLPKGWTETPGSAMRYATLKPKVDGKVDVSVVVLAGEAGGELANVNRWRGQLGLSPVDAAALAKARQEVRSGVGTLPLYDFTGEGAAKSRMLAAIAVLDGNTWFLKMVGDAAAVGAAQPGFLQLLRSLHRDGAK